MAAAILAAPAAADALTFTDVTDSAGLATTHGYATAGMYLEPGIVAGGVAAADYDRDGYPDLFVVRGDLGPAHLFRNRGDGTFTDVAEQAGVAVGPGRYSSATFGDVDGDGWRDLIVVGFDGTQPVLLRNRGDGTFEDITAGSGLLLPQLHSFSASFGDYDRDGDLDLFVSRWSSRFLNSHASGGQLWRNDGSGGFTDVSLAAGIPILATRMYDVPELDLSFTGNFVDIDSDGWLDLLVTVDFMGSRVLRNRGDGTFEDVTDTAVVNDENGMGSAIGDYDNDGDLDWFVTSIWDPNGIVEGNWGITGNRLYRNDGAGNFSDATDDAGVRVGWWGWGATFADLNNDTHLDLVHVNGWGPLDDEQSFEFHDDPARCFLSNGDGTFSEGAEMLGIADRGQGRGVVAFDYDRDGDLDLFFSNNNGSPRLFRNDGGNESGHLDVKLNAAGRNRSGIGARIRATTGGVTQMRELRAGTNFESQNPAEAHFGLGDAGSVEELRVSWPDGSETSLADVRAGRAVVVSERRSGAPVCEGDAPANECITGGGSSADCLVEFAVLPAPPRDPRGVPSRSIRCRDGDACDADGVADGACTFSVSLCINTEDARLAGCTPSDVQHLEITAPRKASRKALERSVHERLASAFGSGGELGIGPRSPLANVSPNHCTAPTDVEVPLGESGTGALRPTRIRVGLKARSSDRRSDTDVISLQCLPGSPVTQMAAADGAGR
ncbi:MAG: CRTAC1 family protein [Candidatus Binatia bacterium]